MIVYGVWNVALREWYAIASGVFHTPHRGVAALQCNRAQRHTSLFVHSLCRRHGREFVERVYWKVRIIGSDGQPVEEE